ncbi:MAG TPA: response regulator transcription factor [Trueperaceae bacterium]|nr:response regulator transcription factor [Trueperaceae bacterium]
MSQAQANTAVLAGRRVLIVEDEESLADIIELYLRQAGCSTEKARDGLRALDYHDRWRPDLLILDLGLPLLDGLEVLRRIREKDTTPVLILTARAEEADEIAGLHLGGDDYLVKPVSARRLLSRVAALMRRAYLAEGRSAIHVGAVEIDSYSHRVTVGGSAVDLTPTEYRLLEHLAATPDRVISRAELIEHAMPESDALERAVDIHLTHLRRKLREAGAGEPIRTVRGVGYSLGADGG